MDQILLFRECLQRFGRPFRHPRPRGVQLSTVLATAVSNAKPAHFLCATLSDLVCVRSDTGANVSLANDVERDDETMTVEDLRALFTMPILEELCLDAFTLRPLEISSSALGATILSLDLALCRCNIIDLDGFFSSFPNLTALSLTDLSNIRQDELIQCLLRRYRTLTSLNLHEMFQESDASDVIGADWIAGFPMLEHLALSGSGLESTSLLYLTRRTISVDVRSAEIDRGALAYAVSRWAKDGRITSRRKVQCTIRDADSRDMMIVSSVHSAHASSDS